MKTTRRELIQAGGSAGLLAALGALGVLPAQAQSAESFDRSLFKTRGINETLKAMGAVDASTSKDIIITSPDIAENGAVVPVAIRSNIPNTESIALLVEKNPNALAGSYDILDGSQPDVAMRIKMGESSDVVALVKAGDKYYVARKEIKVTLGGCGG